MAKPHSDKLLIVEDYNLFRIMLERIFQTKPLESGIADNRKDAIRLAGQIRPKLILLDVILPGILSFENSRALSKVLLGLLAIDEVQRLT